MVIHLALLQYTDVSLHTLYIARVIGGTIRFFISLFLHCLLNISVNILIFWTI